MGQEIRPGGIDILGDIPWGTHFCQFYQTKEDLLDILIPYFKAGLENNEFCMWITAEPLKEQEAEEALRKAMPDFDRYLRSGQLEILPHNKWYLKDGIFNSERVLKGWVDKLNQALAKGYDGLRLTGNTFWLGKSDWQNFTDYEAAINSIIGKYKMLALCTYCLDKCSATEIIDVVRNHEFTLIKQKGQWAIIESATHGQTKEALKESEKRYHELFESMHEGFYLAELINDDAGNMIDSRFLEVNPAYESIIGLSRDQVIGRTVNELFPWLGKPWFEIVSRVVSTGEPAMVEGFVKPIGRYYQNHYYSPRPGQFASIFTDITQRKQVEDALRQTLDELEIRVQKRTEELREANSALLAEIADRKRAEETVKAERQRFNDALETLPAYLVLLTPDYHVPFANRFFRERFGESHGKRCFEYLFGRTEPCEICETYKVLKTMKPLEWEWTGPDSHNYYVYDFPFTDTDGSTLIMEVGIDVTQQKQAEKALRKAYDELEIRVQERTKQLQESEEKYCSIVETANEGILIIDLNGIITFANQRMAELLGYAREELLGRVGMDFMEADQRATVLNAREVLKKGSRIQREYRFRRKDGSLLWTNASVSPLLDNRGRHFGNLAMYTDITERKQAEEELFRVNRAMRAISECNQAMVRATDEQALLKDVCCIICDVAGYRMAWVGVAEHDDAKSVRPLAWGGAEDGYLANAAITWADKERGRGPTGSAVRTGKTQILQDFVTESAAGPWREAALARGYRSSIALPLSDTAGNVFEVLSLYSGQPNGFTPAEVELLEELTADLAFGISVLRDRVKRKQAEKALRDREAELSAIFESTPMLMLLVDADWHVLKSNNAAARFASRSMNEMLGLRSGEALRCLHSLDDPNGCGIGPSCKACLTRLTVLDTLETGNSHYQVECRLPFIGNGSTEEHTFLLYTFLLDLAPKRALICIQDITQLKQAEETLRETRDYLENLIDYANAPIIVWDPGFHITRFNHAFERLTGLKAKDVLGKKLDILFPQDRRDESMAHIRRTVTGERWEVVEIPILRKDGEVRTVLWNSATLYDPDSGTVVATIAQGQDITERKQGEEELRQTRDYLENLINYANAPIIVWDPEFRITRFNHAFERLTGLTAEDVLSKKLDILFPQDRRDESLSQIQRTAAGERWEVVEIPILRKDGEVRTVLWNSATLYDPDGGTVVATIAQGQDITERKQGEETLKRRTDELTRSNAELEQFAYVASHDLQEPLRMVSSYVKLLAKRYQGKLDQDADEFIGYAHDGAIRMQRLINDLLAYSRVGTRGKKFEEVNLETVLAEALHNLKVAIKDNEAVVTHDPLPSVYGDAGQLTQVFQNLIDNAIKFHGEEPPKVHISAEVSRGECVCSVCDNGIGIAPEYYEKVFALFQRLHTSKEYPGTGIGLSICKRIAERHGGRIWVESKPGAGSCFYFTIPASMRKE